MEKEKPPVFGMIQRTGEVVIRMLADVQQKTIGPLIKATIAPGSTVYTDEYDIYHRLAEWGYAHRTVCHAAGEFARETMVTASVRCMSTRWRGSGRCCGRGCVRIAGSRRRDCRCIWASSSSCTTSVGGARPCWDR